MSGGRRGQPSLGSAARRRRRTGGCSRPWRLGVRRRRPRPPRGRDQTVSGTRGAQRRGQIDDYLVSVKLAIRSSLTRVLFTPKGALQKARRSEGTVDGGGPCQLDRPPSKVSGIPFLREAVFVVPLLVLQRRFLKSVCFGRKSLHGRHVNKAVKSVDRSHEEVLKGLFL